MRAWRWIALSLLLTLLPTASHAQRPTATPVPAILARATPQLAQALASTDTPAPSPTQQPSARLEALASAGEVNVRALPDVDSERLGAIVSGNVYPALRKYFRWYEFRYDLSPNGRAWVYGDLVRVAGDAAQIVVIEDYAEIARGLGAGAAQAEDRSIELATLPSDAGQPVSVLPASRLPTFTPPAATQSAFGDQLRRADRDGAGRADIPPIVPIIAMGGAGLLGLLISLLRR